MKREVWIGLLIIACASGVTACSGDDDSSDDGSEAGSGATAGGRAGSGGSGASGRGGSNASGSGGSGASGSGGSGASGSGGSGASGSGGSGASGSGGSGGQDCPASEPTNGSACTDAGGCMYGADMCDCVDDVWACWEPDDCPEPAPAEDSACSPVGMSCHYVNGPGGNCRCETTGWACGDGVRDADGGV